MRRGFQAAAERLAGEVRTELRLDYDDRFDPLVLADAYGVPVASITELVAHGADPASIHQLTIVDRGCFSAGTVFVGTSRLIVYNPSHSDRRLANSISHELSHLVLEHVPGPAIGPGGCRVWDKEVEDEADTLAGMLLVTRDAALACARVGLPHPIGAARFGVSTELMRWRTDHSGAARQAQAAARNRGKVIPSLSAAGQRQLPRVAELEWLADLSAAQWRTVLAECRGALVAGTVHQLNVVVTTPVAVR
ncbi:MAG: ImmA/IrrE family metallo-endopeptidase [Acidimicrobiia bacterium]|nr:ImmA/IrrE family metallo-endopeptidase [Acidimicrobiia bacterium]